MDLPSRYSLDPVAFHKADEAMRKAELWDEWPLLHGEPSGDPPPIALRPHCGKTVEDVNDAV